MTSDVLIDSQTLLIEAAPQPVLRLTDVVSSLTYALDITEGQPEGHALRNCFIGMAIAEVMWLDSQQRSDLYYALLLKDLGCSSNSAKISSLFGADDRQVKRQYKLTNLDNLSEGAAFVLGTAGSSQPLHKRMKHVVDVSLGRDGGTKALMEIRCERGAGIAQMLGFSDDTAQAIRALDEHWDGTGHPYQLAGEAIPLLARILCLAQTAEVFFQTYSPEKACAVIQERSGSWFDPQVVSAFLIAQQQDGFWERLASPDIEAQVRQLEPADMVMHIGNAELDRLAQAFAQIIDAKSPWTYKHSERVCQLAVAAARQLALPSENCQHLYRAALLHDLGKLSIPNTILDKPGRLTDDEFAIIRRHPEHSESIMKRIEPFRRLAAIAAAHHERLDGRGYHRRIPAGTLPIEARILAVADQFEALTASRPYRAGLSTEETLALLYKDAGDGVCKVSLKALEAALEGDPTGQPSFHNSLGVE